jgi:hypothetical protein
LVGRLDGQGEPVGEALLTLDCALEVLDLGFGDTEARQEFWLNVEHAALLVVGGVIAHVATFMQSLNRGNTCSTISDPFGDSIASLAS